MYQCHIEGCEREASITQVVESPKIVSISVQLCSKCYFDWQHAPLKMRQRVDFRRYEVG